MPGGRHLDDVWRSFSRSKDAKGNTRASCHKCGKNVADLTTRMTAHLQSCHESSEPTRRDEIPDEPSDYSATTPRTEVPQAKRPRHQSMLSPVVTDAHSKSRLDLQMAKAFIACNIPFRAIENEQFSNLLGMLRPGYKPPNRRQVSCRGQMVIHPLSPISNMSKLSGVILSAPFLFWEEGKRDWSPFSNDPGFYAHDSGFRARTSWSLWLIV